MRGSIEQLVLDLRSGRATDADVRKAADELMTLAMERNKARMDLGRAKADLARAWEMVDRWAARAGELADQVNLQKGSGEKVSECGGGR